MWNCRSKSRSNATTSDKQTNQIQCFNTPPHKDLQTPNRRACSRYTGLNNGDSPGDEVAHDIIWDPTSPTQGHTGTGHKNTRAVKISDIVNRIAPKDAVARQSPLLQWIGDEGAVSCTPELPRQRARRKSVRLSSVEGLMELARQFDINMQGDTLAQSPSESQRAEAELHALFNSSTQAVDGRLSACSSACGASQEPRGPPPASESAAARSKSGGGDEGAAARPPEDGGPSRAAAGEAAGFEDGWEDDELLNDALLLAMTQQPEPPPRAFPETSTTSEATSRVTAKRCSSVGKPPGSAVPPLAPLDAELQVERPPGILQKLCPKLKTSHRRTFRLEPHPQPHVATADRTSQQKQASVEPFEKQPLDAESKAAKPVVPLRGHTSSVASVETAKDIPNEDRKPSDPDCSWDEWGDDELLIQVCDHVESLSNSQPNPASPARRRDSPGVAAKERHNATAPVAINAASHRNTNASASKQLACGYVRSNSSPGTSSDTVTYQGWNIQAKAVGTHQAPLSQSHPGGHVGRGTFTHLRESARHFQANQEANPSVLPQMVTARLPGNSKSHQSTFKRHSSDSAAVCSKVFVAVQGKGKCSAAEIERKKQEALARKRLRMHNSQKP